MDFKNLVKTKAGGGKHASKPDVQDLDKRIVFGAAAVVILLAAIGFFLFGQEHNDHLIASDSSATVVFDDGSSASNFADVLFDAGLIDSKSAFKNLIKTKGVDSQLKPGTYTLSGGLSLDDLVTQLVNGPNAEKTLTVTEGSTMKSIAKSVEDAYDGKVTAKEFLAACKKPSRFASEYSFVEGASNLEGFLFPKTYDLLKSDVSANNIVRQMLAQYQSETASLDYSYPESQGLSKYQTLILASIVEKEGTSDTYAKVAAVFYNRLGNQGEPNYGLLGSDATTAYELGGDVSGYDWSTNSPYNTRKTKGLCPTPICSPSLATLQAVCNPDRNMNGYYFFSFWPNDNGGVDYFFDKTYADHQKTIADHS